jgi:LPS export ABC transporter protein LptC
MYCGSMVSVSPASDPHGTAFIAGGDRARALVSARRHARLVQALRWLFPAFCLALLGGYLATMMQRSGVGAAVTVAALQKILPTDLKMQNPHYEGFGKDGMSYVLDARTAQQDLKNLDLVQLEGIVAHLSQPGQGKTVINAAAGRFNSKRNVLELSRAIDVAAESGLKARLTQATITTKDGVLVSKEPVEVMYPSGTINAKGMTLLQKRKEVVFAGDVVTVLTPPAKEATAEGAVPQPAESAEPAKPGLFKSTDAPVNITSATLVIKDAEKLASFKGGVKVVQEDGTMTSPELDVSYDGGVDGKGKAEGGADAGPAGSPLAGGKVKRIVARGPVVMTQGPDQRVEAASADFDVANEAAVLDGGVVMTGAEGRRATSDRAELDQRADTALLTGQTVFVQQGTNELSGRRLFIDRKAGRAQLTSPPGAGAGPGRISARFTQNKPEKPAAPAAKSKAPDVNEPAADDAPASAGGFASFKTDPNAPVDINADQLDVDDNKHTATFRGDVVAQQGEFVIRTSEMTATYTGGGALADVAAAPGKGAAAAAGPKGKGLLPDASQGETQLTRIDARKNVVVTSKDGNMARGDWATFDAKANNVTVGGDVTLSKGESLVRGTRLVIDMTSGQSTIDTAPAAIPAVVKPAQGWAATAPDLHEANRNRPSAVLFPKALREAREGPKKEADKTDPARSGWSAATDSAAAPSPAAPEVASPPAWPSSP